MRPPQTSRPAHVGSGPLAGWSRGFTLVELLVTILIIAILAALLFPAGQWAMRTARDSQCKQNLRNLYDAYRSYSLDNDGDTLLDGETPTEWTRLIQPYIGHPVHTPKLPKMLYCPSAKSKPNAEFHQPDYAVNSHGGVHDSKYLTTGPKKLVAQERPARTIIFLDWIPGWRFARAFEFAQVNNPAQYKDLVFRHNRKLNAVFGDGHVESLSHPLPTDIQSPPWR